MYCFCCIERWSQTSDKCPQCKATFGTVTSLTDESRVHIVRVKPRGPSNEPVDDPGGPIELSGDDSERTTDEELFHLNGYRDDGFMARDDEIEYSSDSEITVGGVSLRISMVDLPPPVDVAVGGGATGSDADSDSLRSYWNRRRREVAAERRRRARQREQRRERQARRERAPVVVDLTVDSGSEEPPRRKRLRSRRRRLVQHVV